MLPLGLSRDESRAGTKADPPFVAKRLGLFPIPTSRAAAPEGVKTGGGRQTARVLRVLKDGVDAERRADSDFPHPGEVFVPLTNSAEGI